MPFYEMWALESFARAVLAHKDQDGVGLGYAS